MRAVSRAYQNYML